jgi:hypothetical protein
MYSPLIFDPVELFSDRAVAASTTSDPSQRLETTRLTKVQVRVKNTGASTNVTINIYSVDAATGGISALIQPFTLGSGSAQSPYTAWRYIEKDAIPRYIYAQIVNNDAVNVAKVTVSIDRWR